jgi:coenzyme F420-reducing hydrogenase beta subunit
LKQDGLNDYKKLYQLIVNGGYNYGTGTWAYLNKKIEMSLNKYGEYVPVSNSASFTVEELDQLKENTLLLSNNNETEISRALFSDITDIKYNKRIGYYSGLYIGYVSEGRFRENGSSGGVSSWIFKELLERNEIDYVIQVKKSAQEDKLFEYGISKEVTEVMNSAKTKYYPVEYSEVLDFVRRTPGKYAIIGLPSFITSLRILSRKDKILKKRIKYTIGLVCGHQKTANFANFLAWQCGIAPGKIKEINFRKKLDNLPSNQYAVEITGTVNGQTKKVVKRMSELKGGNWGQGFFKVRASDFTDDVMNETADITLGDAWLPQYTSDSKGNNIVIVRNPFLKKIIDEGIATNKLHMDAVNVGTIIQSQSSHFRHTQDELSYRLYKKDRKNIWRPQKRVKASDEISFLRKKIQDQREKIALCSSDYFVEAVQKNDLNFFNYKITPLVRKYQSFYFLQKVQRKLRLIVRKKGKI